MAGFLDSLNAIISGIVLTNEPVTGLNGVYFLLIFLLLFSLTFTMTAYIPMFSKKQEEYKNIRVIIALSISFLTTITFFTSIVEYIQFFGLVAAIALGLSLGLLSAMPKEKRTQAGTPIAWISIITAVIISLVLLDMTDWVQPILNFIISQWTSLLSTGNIGWLIIIVIAVVIMFAVVRNMEKNRQLGGPGHP